MEEKIKSDIESFLEDNASWCRQVGIGNTSDWEKFLSPKQKVQAYLHWNGIIGYLEEITAAMRMFDYDPKKEMGE